MKKYLLTGCAGFIGSNFVYYMLKKYEDILLVNLDKLTYAGNLENLKGVEDDPRHVFVHGDICDKALVTGLFRKYDFDYIINFAAESHVDRSITNPEIFVRTNVLGTVNLLQCEKEAWYSMQIRAWLYVEDHCKAIDMVANSGKIGEVYNIGGHNERPNIFIVRTIIQRLHDRLQDDGISEDLIRHVEDRLGHDRRYGIDPTKIKNDLGWYPETPFEKGIVLTIDWYLENRVWMNNVTSGSYQKYYEEMYKGK